MASLPVVDAGLWVHARLIPTGTIGPDKGTGEGTLGVSGTVPGVVLRQVAVGMTSASHAVQWIVRHWIANDLFKPHRVEF